MADREKVIKALECCTTLGCHHGCPYADKMKVNCTKYLKADALELLKEHGKQTEYDPEMPCNKKGCDAQTRASCCGCPEQLEYERNKKRKG